METTHKGTVYLSGPISGLTYNKARYDWRETFANGIEPGITVLSPMRHEGYMSEIKTVIEADTGKYPKHYFADAKIIVEKDKLDIKRSDVVVVNLLGAQRVSIGTMVEIGMAFEAGKTIVLVMEDNGNVHEHPFVTQPAALRLNNIDDAIDAVNSLLSEGL